MKKMKGDGNSSRVTHMFPLPKKIMKVSKKLLAAIMAAAMVIPMGTASAFADTDTADTSTKTPVNVTYAVTQEYEWTIHSDIDFGTNMGTNQDVEVANEANKVSVTENIIPDGKKLDITVKGNGAGNAFAIANGGTVLNYDVKAGSNAVTTGGSVLSVDAGTNIGSTTMSFTLHTTKGASEVAGTYKGTLTYTAAVVDK